MTDEPSVTAVEPYADQAAPAPAATASPEPAQTGDPRVDAALRELSGLDGVPIDEHADHYERTHRLLQDALADLDEDASA